MIDLPETKKLIEELKNKPTTDERLEALEMLLLEQLLGGLEDV
jgi:hypothetical protein